MVTLLGTTSSSPAKIRRLPDLIKLFIYANFKSLFRHTDGYKRWRARREELVDAGYLEGRSEKHRRALRASRLPRWNTIERLSYHSLRDGLSRTMNPAGKRVVLAFGHQNYTKAVGGIQLCIGIEEKAFVSTGVDYIYLFPARPTLLTMDGSFAETQLLGIVCNGIDVGICRAGDLTRILAEATSRSGAPLVLALHSVAGHCIDYLVSLKNHLNISEACFWLHDFYVCCPCAHLLYNNHTFCDAPPAGSSLCRLCIYGEFRRPHLAQLENLFNAYPMTLIAPSQFALDFWRSKSCLPVRRALVKSHLQVVQSGVHIDRESAVLRVGYLGATAYHKGWNTFVHLAEKLAGDSRYEFHAFTQSEVFNPHIAGHKVAVSSGDPEAMVRALRDQAIDVVILWSKCPETYSFTMYEAMAAGTFIVTSSSSGNVAQVLRGATEGVVLSSEEELFELFLNGNIAAQYETFCASRMEHIITRQSRITLDALMEPAQESDVTDGDT